MGEVKEGLAQSARPSNSYEHKESDCIEKSTSILYDSMTIVERIRLEVGNIAYHLDGARSAFYRRKYDDLLWHLDEAEEAVQQFEPASAASMTERK